MIRVENNNLSHSIPIIIMTRNEGLHLKKCVESALAQVTVAIHIYIVDNCSTNSEHLNILDKLSNHYPSTITIIRNKINLWILGLNKTISDIKEKHKSPYFIVTDGDIDFSECRAEPCWVSYLVRKMDENIVVGKIGYSLDWSYLEQHKELYDILHQERALYQHYRRIDDMYISSVDTTVAIYRWDWSIEACAGFYPDHMRYLRPELYSCRTDRNYLVRHLGWERYNNYLERKDIDKKIICFTLVGGSIKKEILIQGSASSRFFYQTLSRPLQIAWYFRRYFKLFKYVLLKGCRVFDGQS